MSEERMEVFVASDLTAGDSNHQPDEMIRNRIASFEEALQWIRNGRIVDAKTIAALLHYATFQR